jgi:mono/diheme cytochrome c family protein
MGSKYPIAVLLLLSLVTSTAHAQQKRDDVVARGEYLARAGDCIACHTAPEGRIFAGGRAMPTPFGTLYTSNITPDPETGIGKWSADDFYKTMHSGRFPDGGLIYPAMPFASYTKVTRADSDAIFAYLRSVPPVNQEPAARSAFPLRQSCPDPGAGGHCSSPRASSSLIRSSRPNGIAAPIWSRVSAIAACAIRRSMRSAGHPSRRPSRAG